jgi:hypothetical protein
MEDVKKSVMPHYMRIEWGMAHRVPRPVLFQCITLVMAHLQYQGKKQIHFFQSGVLRRWVVITFTVVVLMTIPVGFSNNNQHQKICEELLQQFQGVELHVIFGVANPGFGPVNGRAAHISVASSLPCAIFRLHLFLVSTVR